MAAAYQVDLQRSLLSLKSDINLAALLLQLAALQASGEAEALTPGDLAVRIVMRARGIESGPVRWPATTTMAGSRYHVKYKATRLSLA